MIKKITEGIPSNSVSYLIICGGIIIIIILLGVIPFYRYNASRSADVKNIQAQIEEQKQLQQAYQSLQKCLKNSNKPQIAQSGENEITQAGCG
jgi:type II secretory pathway pseudopilin PulG